MEEREEKAEEADTCTYVRACVRMCAAQFSWRVSGTAEACVGGAE